MPQITDMSGRDYFASRKIARALADSANDYVVDAFTDGYLTIDDAIDFLHGLDLPDTKQNRRILRLQLLAAEGAS